MVQSVNLDLIFYCIADRINESKRNHMDKIQNKNLFDGGYLNNTNNKKTSLVFYIRIVLNSTI